MSTEELLRRFYEVEEVTIEGEKYSKVFRPDLMVGLKMPVEIRHPATNEVAFKKGIKVSMKRAERFADVTFGKITLPLDGLLQKVCVTDIADPETGEVLLECGQQITEETLALVREKGIAALSVFSLRNNFV